MRECGILRADRGHLSYSEQEKRESWDNIFDITCSFDGEKHAALSTQATLWEIKRE
jgi:hypothetical protein